MLRNLPSETFHVPPTVLCTPCLLLPPGAPPPQDSASCGARPSAAPGLNQHWVGGFQLAGSGHMTTSRLQGFLGKLGSGLLSFLVEGWLSFPSGLMGWGIPQTEMGIEQALFNASHEYC